VKVHNENGQALVLALAFLMFAGLSVGTLLFLGGTSVMSSSQLRYQRSTVYAADGATDAAIQLALNNPELGAYGDPRCQASNPGTLASPIMLTSTATTDDHTVANVVCTWSPYPLDPDRTITFTTFSGDGSSPVIQATVQFHDHWSPVTAQVQTWEYCGHGTSC
jgi:hypothetical protein